MNAWPAGIAAWARLASYGFRAILTQNDSISRRTHRCAN